MPAGVGARVRKKLPTGCHAAGQISFVGGIIRNPISAIRNCVNRNRESRLKRPENINASGHPAGLLLVAENPGAAVLDAGVGNIG